MFLSAASGDLDLVAGDALQKILTRGQSEGPLAREEDVHQCICH